jgi:3-hydroxyacyl-CoA dehydrogenase/enoyl-CoA hydratase/3-hydroxybutyryl-CoA epimerase
LGVGQISGVFSVMNAMAYKTTHGNLPHIKNVLSMIMAQPVTLIKL